MLHEHASGVGSREGDRQPLDGRQRRGEITVGVWRAEHPFLGGDARVLAPFLRLLILAALEGESGLQREPRREDGLAFERNAHYAGTRPVAAFLDEVALLVAADVLEGEDVAQVGIEALDKEVHLDAVVETVVEVDRGAEAVRFLFREVVGQLDQGGLATDRGDVQVLVEGLWRAESARVAGADVDVFRRVEADVGPGAEDHVIDQVMLVEASADEEAPLLVFPLVLQEGALDVDRLVDEAVVADGLVLQVVVVVLQAGGQLGGHEEQAVEAVVVLRPGDGGQVCRPSVGVGVLLGAVVAVAADVLHGGVDVQPVLIVFREEIELQAAAVDRVLHLLGDVGLVGRAVELVAATAELVHVVVFEGQLAVVARLQVRAEADHLVLQLGQLRKAVVVVVEGAPVAVLPEDVEARLPVVGHQ